LGDGRQGHLGDASQGHLGDGRQGQAQPLQYRTMPEVDERPADVGAGFTPAFEPTDAPAFGLVNVSTLPYRVSLPTYPFARKRHWLSAPTIETRRGNGLSLPTDANRLPSGGARVGIALRPVGIVPCADPVPIDDPVPYTALALPRTDSTSPRPSTTGTSPQ